MSAGPVSAEMAVAAARIGFAPKAIAPAHREKRAVGT